MQPRFNISVIVIALTLLLLNACSQGSSSNLGEGVDPALFKKGETLFQANCSACHMTTSNVAMVGPSMIGLVKRAENYGLGMDARSYIRQSIVEPGAYVNEGYQNLMPATFINTLSEDEIEALVSYLMTFD